MSASATMTSKPRTESISCDELNSLKLLTETLKEISLRGTGYPQPGTAAGAAQKVTPADGRAGRDDAGAEPRTILFDIATAIGRFSGFRVDEQLVGKLERVFRNTSDKDLALWLQGAAEGGNDSELGALVEDLTNHETHLYRDPAQLELVRYELLPQIIDAKRRDDPAVIRVWSAACATGEEAYMLCILVLEALLEAKAATEVEPGVIMPHARWRIEVIGSDISRRALRAAREAVYTTIGLGAFRDFPARYNRFFEKVKGPESPSRYADSYKRVKPEVTKWVTFKLHNLMTTTPAVEHADVTFCRNMQIYIDDDRKPLLQKGLALSLAERGALFMSPVDTLVCPELLEPQWKASYVYYSKRR